MNNNILILHHHKNKIKFGLLSFFVLIVIFLGFSAATSYLSYYGGGQCRDIFDNQPIENRQKICCNEDHYNSKDTLCKIKCDAIDVNPNSQFCQELKSSQTESPLAKEIEKPKPLPKQAPKCTEIKLVNFDKGEDVFELKPSNPINIEMKISAKDLQPKYFLYEFFSIEGNDISSIKPISFEKNKTLFAINPATFNSSGEYKDSVTTLHNFFYKQNLNNNNQFPKDVLVVTSIIDESGNKYLQPNSCFTRFTVDQTPNYCKNFSINQENLETGEKIKFSIESNSPTTDSFVFQFLNLDNYEKSGGNKIYKPISFEKVNNKNENYSISKNANGNSKLSFEMTWEDLYQKDLNNKNKFPKNIKVNAYVKPYEKSSLEELVACTVEFKLGGDEGIDNCEDISIGGATKNSDGSITLKTGQFITIKSEAKSKSITEFLYTFHNLDNLNSSKLVNNVKDAEPIFFSKSDPYEIEKSSSRTSSKSILVSFDDLNKIDLSTGSKPKNIQVRAFFVNTDGRVSALDSDCAASFKIE
jgi:hypothetical protein